MQTVSLASNPDETHRMGVLFADLLRQGDIVLLAGELGAGKTSFVRGVIRGLGHDGTVRSPTFNLIQTFDTRIPVMHADLYRLNSAEGLGLEDYFSSHISLIEWSDRLGGMLTRERCWQIQIDFAGSGRQITITPPAGWEESD